MPELKKEQKQAVFHNDGNILVSASAGSGKTFVMIERAIRLITEGKASVKEILAVTFTELAASEMKEKLKDALVKKINQTESSKLLAQLNEVATSDICTLHSFCARLVRTYFYKVGVAPDFKILDEDSSSVLLKESIDKAFKEFYESGEQWFLTITERHSENRSDDEFKKTLMRMRALCYVNADTDIYRERGLFYNSEQGFNHLLKEYMRSVNDELDRIADTINDTIKVFRDENQPKHYDFACQILEDINVLRTMETPYQFEGIEFKRVMPRLNDKSPSEKLVIAREDLKIAKNQVKELIDSVKIEFKDRESDQNALSDLREHSEGLFRILRRFDAIYIEAKQEENGLDFSDLEHFALKVLSDNEIRQTVKNKYKYVFVDEYQDVNGVQEEIITAVSNNNLFMVGDAKQSIYGFRGCRPEIFIDKQSKMMESGETTVLLNHNFRSANAVLNTANNIFSYSMTEKYYGADYERDSMLIAGGVYPEGCEGRSELHLLKTPPRATSPEETPRIYNILEEIKKSKEKTERTISLLIANIINEECEREIYDTKKGCMRKVERGDIAVLTRNTDNAYVRSIVKGLASSGISTVSVVKESVCDFPEIKTLISALELVDCFSQDIPLASTLKSAIGEFSDEDLAKIVISYNDSEEAKGSDKEVCFYNAFTRYLTLGEDERLKRRLNEFKDYFDRIRLLSDFVGAYGVLKRIVSDKDIEQNLYAECFGREKVSRLNRFISASVVEDRVLSVKEFINRINNFPTAFGLSDTADENAVKVMTIHASKGLEFPVVIVCGLERNANSREEREDIMFDFDMGFALKEYNDEKRTISETPLRALFRRRMQENRLKEELRLFYVALTRASYSLHMTFESGKDGRSNTFKGASKFLDYLPKSIEATEHEPEDFVFENKKRELRKVLIGTPNEFEGEKMKKSFDYEYPFIEDTALSLKVSVTSSMKEDEEQVSGGKRLFDEEQDENLSSDRKEQGIIAHKILELFDFSKKNEFYVQVENMVSSGEITKENLEKINLERLKKALECSAFDNLEGKTLYREKEFIVSVDGDMVINTTSKETVLMQGIIDLLAVDDKEAVIIDYKYSVLSKENLKNKYAKQLNLYAYALEKATGIKVKTKAIINVFRGESVIID